MAAQPKTGSKAEGKTERSTGIVRRLPVTEKVEGGEIDFSPDYTVTSTTDGGGNVLTDVEVILCFWGSFWSTTPAPTPSSDTYRTAIEGIVTGPYLGGLRQYRGVGQGSVIYSEINDSTSPANGYTDSDVVTMLKDRIQNHGMPAPVAGHNRFYAVIAPVGINNSLTQFAGQHQSFTVNGVTGYYAWVDNTGSLTGHNCTTKVFSHELVEALTNPDVDTSNNSILVNGTGVTNDEIGDTCNNQFATVDMNGVQCSVQAYWSKAGNICILPVGTLAFWVDKSTFGRDEVQDIINTSGGKVDEAFWLVVEGYSKTSFTALNVTVPVPTGPFANIPGITITQNPAIDFENGLDPDAQQRIRVPFDITFTSTALTHFPGTGSQTYQLNAFIATDGNKVSTTDASTLFELVAGADPYFTNIDPTQQNVFYLSQDLRVFTATPAQNAHPVPGGPAFASDSTAGAFTYVQDLLNHLNANFRDTAGPDPFNTVLPAQGNAFTQDSSVTPFTFDFSHFPNINIYNNYNFAIARVRMRGSSGPPGKASNVRVFFRMWSTQTPDTDYQPASTYPFNADASGNPGSPQVGAGHITLPFCATGNVGSNTDYDVGGVNNQDIEIDTGHDTIWKYYGCFLNLYDPSNTIDGSQVQAWLNGTHHCIVAQIAFDDTPISIGANPEASDKLAQRNLQVTHSDNPGPASTHRIPQTFDIRPSAIGGRNDYVDELMIDWGAIPKGSVASIYWPQVQASDVLMLATMLYPSHTLTATDNHTIACKVTGGVTYIPVPMAAGENFAGLFTVDLPTTVVTGQEFNIVVRRVGRKGKVTRTPPPQTQVGAKAGAAAGAVASHQLTPWRYVIGTFQVKIPVTTSEVMLFPEENTLAIMKWRLQLMAPSNRWYLVLKRYIQFISDRVRGLGGDPDAIPPSPNGAPPKPSSRCDDLVELRGKVAEIRFDCFGDLEGFVLDTCCEVFAIKTRERELGQLVMKACKERLTISVFVARHEKTRLHRLVIHA
ncbi:MAG: hypothetical protein U0163_17195 [Gemmatimonadaceae bacterium]